MNVVRLVVESQRWRAVWADAQLGLHDVDGQVECVVVPGRMGNGGELVGARVRLLAAAILILQLEPQRLARVETLERPVERRGLGHAERRTHSGRRLVELEQRRERRLRRARAGEPNAARAGRDFPAEGRRGVAVYALLRVDLDHAPLHAHRAHRGGVTNRFQHRHDTGTPAGRTHDIERLPFPISRPARPFRPDQLAIERKERPQPPRADRRLEQQRCSALRNDLLHSRHELIHELPGGPPSPAHLPRPQDVPWQLEHVFGTTRQLHHIEQVSRAGHEGACDLAVAPANPGPLARGVERLAHRVARRLGHAVQSWRVVGQRRPVPEKVARDIRSGSRIGQPVNAIRVEREMQPVGVPVPATVWATLETRIAASPGRAQHGEALRFEEDAAREPSRCP